uniref:Importin N-terminal domain-containing protein n=1 Tax=Aureoumbra lagunensis TaxID=44058 RepID=A0A7S3NJ13_9STRA
MEQLGQRLLDESQSFDVGIFDNIISVAYEPRHPERAVANTILMKYREQANAWSHADTIIEKSQIAEGRYFGLMALDDAINTRWKILPDDQKAGIKGFIVNKIIQLSSDENSANQERKVLHQMNKVLVSILKQEWPHNWPSFIGDICGASKTSEILCENNMHILRLLSEEVFDFSRDAMTTEKIAKMKQSLNAEFAQIFRLCEFVLCASSRPKLIDATLATLKAFLSWIPLGYIFETPLIETLINRFFAAAQFRNAALECLTEIGSLTDLGNQKYNDCIINLYLTVLRALQIVVPPDASLAAAFQNGGNERDQIFVQRLALFFSGFFKAHLRLVETPQHAQYLLDGLNYLVRISTVPDNEIFQICLDFWHFFTADLYASESSIPTNMGLLSQQAPGLRLGERDIEQNGFTKDHDDDDDEALGGGDSANNQDGRPVKSHALPPPITSAIEPGAARKSLFQNGGLLSQVRLVMISRMAKPEEVLVVEDENGNIVREMTKDTEAIAQYKTMREALVYLTHLNYDDTESIMLDKLSLQVDGTEWSWANLNTLCWAIGSISGAMTEDEEKRFLVTVIKDLLGLCEHKRGKDNKACIASNIMYVVGQYPRFLRAHWKFLKTVVNKLFEFMHELHPGVQDMACDTFLKIAHKCKKKFITQQPGEIRPFIHELIQQLPQIISDLHVHQVHAFYEATATLLSDRQVSSSGTAIIDRQMILGQLMALPNETWRQIATDASRDRLTLQRPEVIRELSKIVRTHARVCGACGAVYVSQLGTIYLDLLNVYREYSEAVTNAVASGGEIAARRTEIRAMRGAKREIIKLFATFIEKCAEPEAPPALVATSFIPPLLNPLLGDYRQSIAEARDSECLNLLAATVEKLRDFIAAEIPRILDAVFEPTLAMITRNFEDFPEHRLAFFKLLQAVNTHCFTALFSIPVAHHKLIIDSIVWALKHTERNVADTGLDILYELLINVGRAPEPAKQQFYQAFLLPLLQEILAVLTDRLHKSGFRMHATILRHIFHLVEAGHVTVPLYDTANTNNNGQQTNQAFLRDHVANLLISSFPNLTKRQVVDFVVGLFDLKMTLPDFKTLLRNFLIELKEFQIEDNRDLFSEEAAAAAAARLQQEQQARLAVPGLINPHDALNDRNMDDDDL